VQCFVLLLLLPLLLKSKKKLDLLPWHWPVVELVQVLHSQSLCRAPVLMSCQTYPWATKI